MVPGTDQHFAAGKRQPAGRGGDCLQAGGRLTHAAVTEARTPPEFTSRGFTLLELLVALSIFALISAMAYGGMSRVLGQQAQTEAKADKLQQLQITYTIFERDFGQLVNRPVRNAYGNSLGALVGSDGIDGVELTRSGRANPAGFRRSGLQRVRYISEDEKLLRQAWKVLDRSPDSEAVQQVLYEPLDAFSLRYLDDTDKWRETWPPVVASTATSSTPVGLPKVVEVTLETRDFGRLTWLFRSPEAFTAGALPKSASPPKGNKGATKGNNGTGITAPGFPKNGQPQVGVQ